MAIRVAIIGSTGRQGSSTTEALLRSKDPQFEVIALLRPESVNKKSATELSNQGVKIVPIDIRNDSQEKLVSALANIDVIVSFLPPNDDTQPGQIALATAAKEAGVKRFVINAWGTVTPPKGVLKLREMKQEILDHVQKLYLPWTWIDIGFWHDVLISRIPSGKLDPFAFSHKAYIIGQGSVPCAVTSAEDVGSYVARIIADQRTLNRFVFAYGELQTEQNAVEVIERLSGEKVNTFHLTPETLIRAAEAKDSNYRPYYTSTIQYFHSAFVRGDNQPEKAKFLGYVDAKELYPDFKPTSFEETVSRALAETDKVASGRSAEFWDEFETILKRFETK